MFLRTLSFSTRLVLGVLVLIVVTTLSAGVPAYWITRAQLEQQAWSNVMNAQQATSSLLQAERTRLTNLTTLFAERPTLQRLAQRNIWSDLRPYLQAFQDQSDLDILLFCASDDTVIVGNTQLFAACPATGGAEFALVNGQPAILKSQAVFDETSGERIGTAVAGIWLDRAFLRRLASDTGVEQSIVSPDGVQLASSIDPGQNLRPEPPLRSRIGEDALQRRHIDVAGSRYYAGYLPLGNTGDQARFVAEVALPVDDLLATETRALGILAASTGLVALLGAVLGVWYVRQLTAPLQRLTDVADRISRGDLTTPIPRPAGPAEVTTLATALQQSQASMLDALHERSQARDWLNTIIQSIVEGVITIDTDGTITFISKGAEVVSGWTAAEAHGRHINELFSIPGDSDDVFLDRIPPSGDKRQIDVVTRTGKTTTLAVTRAELVPLAGDTVNVALVLRDVTEEEARRHLRSYFLSNITHEFRTPLSTLNASIELLMDESQDLTVAEMRELLTPTYLSLVGLHTLVDNLLESSRIEAGHFTIRRQPTDLNQVITDALRVVQPLLDRRRQSIALSEPAAVPELYVDPTRLLQALINLLTNASKYSPEGEYIDLSIELTDDALRVAVADRGPGIPPIERANLFHRFVRLNSGDSEQYGIGLGLYVVKTAIEAHGGQVGVDGRPGGGSIFWFDVPLLGEGDSDI